MNRPLRIVQLNSLFMGGGVDNQTLELTTGLRELGTDVTLAVAAGSRWEKRAHTLGVPVVTFPSRSPLKWRTITAVRSVVRRTQADILHLHQGRDYWPGILGARLALTGTRVVITRHLMTRPRGFSRHFLLRAAHVIAVSHAVEGVLRTELSGDSGKISQAHCGFDLSRYAPERTAAALTARAQQGWTPEQIVFGVVGMYDLPRGKGQLEFLEAAARVRTSHPSARFVLIGQGSMRALIEERIEVLKLGDAVRLIPFTDDIIPLHGALDVLVHPAVGTDAFPLVVLEALASGRPVIASAIDGIVEQFRDGEHGLFVPRADINALTAAMNRLADDAPLRARMGRAGRAHVEANFTRAKLGENVLAIYRRILGDDNP